VSNEYEELEKLGFSKNEAKVYLALLKLGSSLAGKIAKETLLDRSSTYSALKVLHKKGVISTYFENKRTIFSPEDPKRLMDYFIEKQEIAKNVITKLKEVPSSTQKSQTIKLYRGYKGMKSVLNEILELSNNKSPYYIMGSQGQFRRHMPYYAPIFRKIKLERKIKTKIITKELPDKRSKLSEYGVVPSDVDSPATINIYSGKVAIFLWDDNQAIVIDNPAVARTFENYFSFMWKYAKK